MGYFFLYNLALIGCDPIAVFNNLNSNTQNKLLLGYDPHIRLVYDELPSTGHDRVHPTIYLHGFGDDSQNFQRYLQIHDEKTNHHYLLVKPAIFFDFPDAQLKNAKTWWEKLLALNKSSLGQLPDILPFIRTLNLCRLAGFKAIDLFGFSRGGATVLNTISILSGNKYVTELGDLGIDVCARQEIVSMLMRGCITIDCPLKKLHQKMIHDYGDFLGSFVSSCIVPLVTQFRPWAEQPINAFDSASETRFNILIHYEENDDMVSNWGDSLLYKKACNANGTRTFVHTSHDGGHIAYRKELPQIFHAFKKICGYTDVPISYSEATLILNSCRPDPATLDDN